MTTKTKELQLIDLKSTSDQLKIAVKDFRIHEKEIKSQISTLSTLPEITDKATRDSVHSAISKASKSIRAYSKLRLEATRPLDALKKNVITHENEQVLPLKEIINALEINVIAFDAVEEEKRLAELARIEAERKAREEKGRIERARVEGHKQRIAMHELQLTSAIVNANNTDDLNDIALSIKEIQTDDFEEFKDEIAVILNRLIKQGKTKRTQIEETERLEAARKEAEAKNNAAQAELLAAQQKQAEERAKLQREQEELERQRQENERAKREAAAEAQRIKEAKEAREEEARKIKELQAARAKGISSGIDDISITNISLVPTDLYEVKFNLNKVKAALKNGDIPGLEISFKTGLRLNG